MYQRHNLYSISSSFFSLAVSLSPFRSANRANFELVTVHFNSEHENILKKCNENEYISIKNVSNTKLLWEIVLLVRINIIPNGGSFISFMPWIPVRNIMLLFSSHTCYNHNYTGDVYALRMNSRRSSSSWWYATRCQLLITKWWIYPPKKWRGSFYQPPRGMKKPI